MNFARIVRSLLGLALASMSMLALAIPRELHDTLAVESGARVVALTLDACGGGFDQSIVDYLIKHRIPATIFATSKWMRHNAAAMRLLALHRDLFEIEDHGMNHVPAVIGVGSKVYGIAGHRNAAGLVREVLGGAAEIEKRTGTSPRWYRGATGLYDADAVKIIEGLGYRVAGFSVNADQGARLPFAAIVKRLAKTKNGDVIIAHLNKPASETAKGLAAGLGQLERNGFHFVPLENSKLHRVN